jgi:hypothetical protein
LFLATPEAIPPCVAMALCSFSVLSLNGIRFLIGALVLLPFVIFKNFKTHFYLTCRLSLCLRSNVMQYFYKRK